MPDRETETTRGARQTSLRDILNVLFRHKWKMVIFFLATFGAVAAMTLLAPDSYRSQAKILLRFGRESVSLDPTATSGGQVLAPTGRTRESEIHTETQIMQSDTVARKVADGIDLDAFKRAEAKAKHPAQVWIAQLVSSGPGPSTDAKGTFIGDMSQKLKVETTQTDIINMSYESAEPEFAHQVLAKAIDEYLIEHVAVHKTPGSYEFFAEQYDLTKKRLDALESQLSELKRIGDISAIDQQISIALGRANALRDAVTTNDTAVAASTARVARLKAALQGLPLTVVASRSVGTNPALDTIRARLNELQIGVETVAADYEENSRQVQSLRRQIQKAQELAKQEDPNRASFTEAINTTRTQIEQLLLEADASRESLVAQTAILKKELQDVQAQLPRLSEASNKIKSLSREIALEEANYQKYSENRELARIEQAMQAQKISNISVLQPATLPSVPYGPNRPLLLAIGLILGILGATSIAFVADLVDHAIRTPDDVEERLHLPTLASVPLTPNNTVGPAGRRRSLLGLLRNRKPESPAPWVVPSAVRPQYDMLREAVVLAFPMTNGSNGMGDSLRPDANEGVDGVIPMASEETPALRKGPRIPKARKRRLVGIVGSRRGEGVSVVAANLASSLATQGRVLLVDANVNDPSAQDIFSVSDSPGLVDLLSDCRDWQRAIAKTQVPNLDVLPAGVTQGGDTEMDLSQFQKLAGLLTRHYDYVVVDLPPVGEGGAGGLASLCDHVGLVVEAERSRWEVVRMTKGQLDRVHAHVLGVVLNKRQFHIPGWLYRTV